jgi:carbonic anhydrase
MKAHCHQDLNSLNETHPGRRQFLGSLLIGGGAAVLAPAIWPSLAFAAGHTDVLLLSCMDYRLVGKTRRYMVRQGLGDKKYDQIVLAGAALGAVTDKYPEWNKTFWDELGLAIDLHGIHKVMILDHRDCGAYQQIFGIDFARHPAEETRIHAEQLRELRKQIDDKYVAHVPHLKVELLLMNLKGQVQKIPSSQAK